MGDLGLIPGLERFPGEGNGYSLQYSSLENSRTVFHGVAKNRTQQSNFHALTHGRDTNKIYNEVKKQKTVILTQ